MTIKFGDFQPLCSSTPSYPWCNLFYRRLQRFTPNNTLTGLSIPASSAPVGINPSCGIPGGKRLGNIFNIIACSLSIIWIFLLAREAFFRKYAAFRIEVLHFLTFYFFTLICQIFTIGSFLEQGSHSLVTITAIHAGLVVTFFWSLLFYAIVFAIEVIPPGTKVTNTISNACGLLMFLVTLYISLDLSIGVLASVPNPSAALRSDALFALTSIWPITIACIYFCIMLICSILQWDSGPVWHHTLAAILFILSQLAWFLLGQPICKITNSLLDGSCIATFLETAAVWILYTAWADITTTPEDNSKGIKEVRPTDYSWKDKRRSKRDPRPKPDPGALERVKEAEPFDAPRHTMSLVGVINDNYVRPQARRADPGPWASTIEEEELVTVPPVIIPSTQAASKGFKSPSSATPFLLPPSSTTRFLLPSSSATPSSATPSSATPFSPVPFSFVPVVNPSDPTGRSSIPFPKMGPVAPESTEGPR